MSIETTDYMRLRTLFDGERAHATGLNFWEIQKPMPGLRAYTAKHTYRLADERELTLLEVRRRRTVMASLAMGPLAAKHLLLIDVAGPPENQQRPFSQFYAINNEPGVYVHHGLRETTEPVTFNGLQAQQERLQGLGTLACEDWIELADVMSRLQSDH